ncbi:hypothetical protein M408DRAFT_31525, partial [Serendipita vermifera MAFF 305830]
MPRKGNMPVKSRIPQVKRVVAVSSAKGGVGKSTVAANLAMALSMLPSRPKIGLLDLDIFGPSIPRIMGLNDAPEPEINKFDHLIPLQNHGIQCMSMGFLLSRDPKFERKDPATETSPTWRSDTRESAPIVWRGLMVQKATQQLLFEVDWSGGGAVSGGIDVLVVDMPPGTGDVALTLGQLVVVDGAIIVSTAQDVALADVKKGVAMFQKVKVPMLGMLLNMSHYVCPSCTTKHDLFGSSASIENAAQEMGLQVLGKLPLVSQLSSSADRGVPLAL